MDYFKGSHIAEAAKSLYLAEVVLTESAVAAKDSIVSSNRSSESCRCQLLTVLGEVVLDESMPAAGVPFCMANVQTAAPVLGDVPAARVFPGDHARKSVNHFSFSPARDLLIAWASCGTRSGEATIVGCCPRWMRCSA